MCDQCDNSSLSRRELLKLAGAASALFLASCQDEPAVPILPDVVYEEHLVEGAGAVRIDPKLIKPPPPMPAQKSTYGDIMPRAAWTRTPLRLREGTPMDGIHKITIHHSGDGKPFLGTTPTEVATHLQIVQQAHLQRGMIDIAYHFAVDRTGRLWQLRWLAYEGQHVRMSKNGTRNNEHNVGVVVLGDFNIQAPTVAQRDRLFELIRKIKLEYSPPPMTALPVYLHGEIVETDCPGKRLAPILKEARQRHSF